MPGRSAGYIHKGALLRRVQPGLDPAGRGPVAEDSELAAGKRVIDGRYRQLLGGAVGHERTYLTDTQRLWETQRRRCQDVPEPGPCRAQLDAQRLADLNDWRDARSNAALQPAERPGMTLTVSALR
jgi:hypothetical protein